MLIPSWSGLKRWGNSRLVKTSYLWIIIIPIIAKVLDKIPDEVAYEVFESKLVFTLAFPFKWKLFYFGSILFATAQALYSFKCPFHIKRYRNYLEYNSVHSGINEYVIAIKKWISESKKGCKIAKIHIERIIDVLLISPEISGNPDLSLKVKSFPLGDNSESSSVTEIINICAHKDDIALNDIYYLLRGLESQRHPLFRILCTGLFIGGGVVIFWLLVDSFFSVINA